MKKKRKPPWIVRSTFFSLLVFGLCESVWCSHDVPFYLECENQNQCQVEKDEFKKLFGKRSSEMARYFETLYVNSEIENHNSQKLRGPVFDRQSEEAVNQVNNSERGNLQKENFRAPAIVEDSASAI